MKRPSLILTISIFFLLMLSQKLEAEFILTFDTTVSWSGDYYPFETSQGSQQESGTLKISKEGNSPTNVLIGASSSPSSPYRELTNGANTLQYLLYQDASLTTPLLSLADAASASDLISATAGPKKGDSATVSYYLTILPEQIVPPGTYTDTVNFNVYTGSFGSTSLQLTVAVQISVTVLSQPEAVIVDLGDPYNASQPSTYSMDFAAGSASTQYAYLRVRTNDGYIVQARSINDNRLNHTTASGLDMGYEFYAGGQYVDLSSGSDVQIASASGTTTNQGNPIILSITLNDRSNKLAGTYQDNIVFTISNN